MTWFINDLIKYHFILASASPRRSELLRMVGFPFEVIPSQVAEIYHDHLTPIEYVLQNARKKGEAVAMAYPQSVVIAADTVVVLKGELLEKPKDKPHARQLLQKLSGQMHQVYTGFGLINKAGNKILLEYEKTDVTFRQLSNHMIEWYLETDEPYDKAGAYGAQGKGALLIASVHGCYFNVIGLPLSKFFQVLNKFLNKMQQSG
jgi:septum formation protein